MKCFRFAFIVILLFGASFTFSQNTGHLIHKKIYFTVASHTNSTPTLDGILNDACWKNATEISHFVLTAGDYGKPAKNRTESYVAYDDAHLYIAFRCYDSNISGIKSTSKIWDDSDILYDDRVEVFLDINHDHRSYFELAVNPNGVQFDQSGFNRLNGSKTCDMDPSWNAFWRAKTKINKNDWVAEIAIDVTSLGIKKVEKGMTWGFNVARVRQPDVKKGDEFFKRVPHGEAEYSAWSPVKDYIRETISNFHAPLEFGDLVFGDPGFAVEELSFKSALYAFGPVGYPSLFGYNPLEIKFKMQGDKTEKAVLKMTVEPESVAKWQSEKIVTLDSQKPVHAEYYIPENQENKIIIQLLDPKSKKQLYRTSYIEIAPPFIEFNLESLYARTPEQIHPVGFRLLMDAKTRTNSHLRLALRNSKSNKILASATIVNLHDQFMPVFDTNELRALPGGTYNIDCTLLGKDGKRLAHFTQNFTKFANELPKTFHATEGNYSYGGIVNQAVQILYPFPAKFVFWRSASYIPIWDIDQAAMTNEFIECWGAGNQGCNEPMQDRECRYSNVELLENTPARVVVHWRYALSDPHYRIYRNEWVDEYYAFYPDGVGVRQVNLWPNSNTRHEMLEVLLAKPPCVHTEQLYDKEFATLANLNGKEYSNKAFCQDKKLYKNFLKSGKDFIIEIHFKDRLHPFTVFSFRNDLLPGVTRDHVTVISKDMASADQRGHWPASRYQIDGYNTVGLDVPNHGNIGNIQAEVDPKFQPMTWTFLIGVKEKGSNKDRLHAGSWLYPAKVEMSGTNCKYAGYDYSQRAYVIKSHHFKREYRLVFSSDHTIINPVFKIYNEESRLKEIRVDGKKFTHFVVGNGADRSLIVFIKGKFSGRKSLNFKFIKSQLNSQK